MLQAIMRVKWDANLELLAPHCFAYLATSAMRVRWWKRVGFLRLQTSYSTLHPPFLHLSEETIMSLLRLHNAREAPYDMGTVPWIPKPVDKTKTGMLDELLAAILTTCPWMERLVPTVGSGKPLLEDWMSVFCYSSTPVGNSQRKKEAHNSLDFQMTLTAQIKCT